VSAVKKTLGVAMGALLLCGCHFQLVIEPAPNSPLGLLNANPHALSHGCAVLTGRTSRPNYSVSCSSI
jgi:hypothetical protein